MSNGLRVPPFIREEFHSLNTKGEKEKFLQAYRQWRNSEYTELFVSFLEEKLQDQIREDEKEDSFVSLFQSKYKAAHTKGSRKTLRETIKSI